MRRQRKGLPAGLLLLFVFAAALTNLLLGIAAQRLLALSEAAPDDSGVKNVMEISLLPSTPRKPKTQEEEKKRDKPKIDKDLVVNHEIVREEAPDDAKRISEFDNNVDRETMAPRQKTRPGQVARRSQARPDSAEQQQTPAEQRRRSSARRSDSKEQSTQAPSQSQGPAVDPSRIAQSAREADDGRLAPGQGARTGLLTPRAGTMQTQRGQSLLRPQTRPSPAAPPAPSLAGSPSQLRQVLGSLGSFDHVKDVDEGQKNIFKTRRYRFASFFNRVRIAIAQEWHPEVVHAARDPYGNIYGSKDRTTRLMIRLAKDGSLVRASLDYSCGVSYLDEEAIRAVRTAQPFTHPPPELIDPETGYIEFLFAFTLEISGRRRIFRTSRK